MNSDSSEVQVRRNQAADVDDMREQLAREGLSYYRWSNNPGYEYPAHQHGYHKVIVVERGSITFSLKDPDQMIELKAGDRLELPAGTIHSATVGMEGVACLEAHLQ